MDSSGGPHQYHHPTILSTPTPQSLCLTFDGLHAGAETVQAVEEQFIAAGQTLLPGAVQKPVRQAHRLQQVPVRQSGRGYTAP